MDDLDDQVDAETRKKLFDLTTSQHISLAVSGGQGQGVDQHLFDWLGKKFPPFQLLLPLFDILLDDIRS